MRLLLILSFSFPILLFAQVTFGVKAEYIHQQKQKKQTSLESYLLTNHASLGIQVIPPQSEPVIGTDDDGNFSASVQFGPKQEENIVYHTDYENHRWTAKLFIADEPFLVTDMFTPLVWEMAGSSKEIAGYYCYAATTYFRGRNYTAYFTPEIPISAGPYKFGGLPGLILEITTADGNYAWYCKSITTATASDIAKITPPEGKEPISHEAFQDKTIAFLKSVIDRLRSLDNIRIDSEPVFDRSEWLELPEKQ